MRFRHKLARFTCKKPFLTPKIVILALKHSEIARLTPKCAVLMANIRFKQQNGPKPNKSAQNKLAYL